MRGKIKIIGNVGCILALLAAALTPSMALAQGIKGLPQWERIVKKESLDKGTAPITLDKIKEINADINATIDYNSDAILNDVWQLPTETAQSGAGDCEDIAALKYYRLAANGMDTRKMFLVVGEFKAEDGSEVMHAVVQVEIEGEKYVLDIDHNGFEGGVYTAENYYKNMAVSYGVNHHRLVTHPQYK